LRDHVAMSSDSGDQPERCRRCRRLEVKRDHRPSRSRPRTTIPADRLPIRGRVHIKALAAVLSRTDEHPWPARIGAGHFGGQLVDLVRVEPTVVVEVAGDAAQQAGRWCHQLRLLRLRPDLTPAQVQRPQPLRFPADSTLRLGQDEGDAP
jgi:hypothetical protein